MALGVVQGAAYGSIEDSAMTVLAGTMLLMGAAVAQQQKFVGTSPFCLSDATGPTKCEFQTMAQCEQAPATGFFRSLCFPLTDRGPELEDPLQVIGATGLPGDQEGLETIRPVQHPPREHHGQ